MMGIYALESWFTLSVPGQRTDAHTQSGENPFEPFLVILVPSLLAPLFLLIIITLAFQSHFLRKPDNTVKCTAVRRQEGFYTADSWLWVLITLICLADESPTLNEERPLLFKAGSDFKVLVLWPAEHCSTPPDFTSCLVVCLSWYSASLSGIKYTQKDGNVLWVGKSKISFCWIVRMQSLLLRPDNYVSWWYRALFFCYSNVIQQPHP